MYSRIATATHTEERKRAGKSIHTMVGNQRIALQDRRPTSGRLGPPTVRGKLGRPIVRGRPGPPTDQGTQEQNRHLKRSNPGNPISIGSITPASGAIRVPRTINARQDQKAAGRGPPGRNPVEAGGVNRSSFKAFVARSQEPEVQSNET
jgi:hypothetical protein